MGLDIYLTKVLSKSEVDKLKKKHTDLIYPDEFSFIEIQHLVNCETNIETLNLFKDCLVENENSYYILIVILKEIFKFRNTIYFL